MQLGYLRAEHAYRMGKLLQAGHTITAVFQEATRYGAAIRVAFDGEEPSLPSRQEQQSRSESRNDADSGFWPDEIWPDD